MKEMLLVIATVIAIVLLGAFVNFESAFILTVVALVAYAFWGDRIGRHRRNPEIQRINEEEIATKLKEAWNARRAEG